MTFRCRFNGTLDLPKWDIGKTLYSSSYLPAGFHYSVVHEGLYIPSVWESLNNTVITCLFTVYTGSGNFSRIESSPAYLIVVSRSGNDSDNRIPNTTNTNCTSHEEVFGQCNNSLGTAGLTLTEVGKLH